MDKRAKHQPSDDGEDAAETTLTLGEAADDLGVDERTVRRAITRGELDATRDGRAYRISGEALAGYRARAQRKAAPLLPFAVRTGPPHVRLVERESSPALTIPQPLTGLIGRQHEIAAIGTLLRQEEVRLVNLTGAGGVGKTRLAIQLAASLDDAFPDGVAFIPLATISDPGIVAPTLVQAFGLHDRTSRSPTERLIEHLRSRILLLILDNFEQVVPAAPLLTTLLASCPHLKILVTSRTVLAVSGERQYPVPPLPLDAPGGGETVETASSDAVRLFVERAQAESPAFCLTAENAPTIAAICARLEGIPLAIELAAARVRLLSPAALLARLEHRLPLLTGGRRDAPMRQRTMRDAIAWSHDLLSPEEQICFRRLAVFVGGFTLEGGETVVARVASEGPGGDIFANFTALVDAHLLQHDQGPAGVSRLVMLETVREYALEKLVASGEERAARLAHGDYVMQLAERAHDEALHGRYRSPLVAEQANLRAVLSWFEEAGETERSLILVGALWPFWYVHGPNQESRGWVERALARDGGSPMARGRALYVCGQLAAMQGDTERAAVCFQQSLIGARGGGFTLGVASSLLGLGWVAMQQADFARARERCEDALELIWQVDDPDTAVVTAGLILSNLGSVAYAQGDFALASARFAEALGHQRSAGHRWGEAFSLTGLAYVARAQRDERFAGALFAEALPLFSEHEDWRMTALAVAGVAGLASAGGQTTHAARLFGTAAALRQTGGLAADPAYRAINEQDEATIRAALGEAAFATAWSEGQAMPLEDALVEASSMATSIESLPPQVAPPAARFGLTQREIEVLRLLARRLTDREIAETLFISPKTAGNHVSNILAKLEATDRREAAALAARHGLA